jgi:hypothetical protein
MKRAAAIAFLAGLLPVIAVGLAYLVNMFVGDGLEPRFTCMPFWEGCVSISRAARSGPGLYLFRAVMLPCAVLILLSWRAVRAWLLDHSVCSPRRARIIFVLGAVGAVFLVFYVTALGSEGEWYRWLRRYGVTVYFGGTALAQLLLVASLWPERRQMQWGRLHAPIALLMSLVSVQWVLGVLSVLKRLLISDPDLVDRIENIIEWWFALPMALAFIAIAWIFRRSRLRE